MSNFVPNLSDRFSVGIRYIVGGYDYDNVAVGDDYQPHDGGDDDEWRIEGAEGASRPGRYFRRASLGKGVDKNACKIGVKMKILWLMT